MKFEVTANPMRDPISDDMLVRLLTTTCDVYEDSAANVLTGIPEPAEISKREMAYQVHHTGSTLVRCPCNVFNDFHLRIRWAVQSWERHIVCHCSRVPIKLREIYRIVHDRLFKIDYVRWDVGRHHRPEKCAVHVYHQDIVRKVNGRLSSRAMAQMMTICKAYAVCQC